MLGQQSYNLILICLVMVQTFTVHLLYVWASLVAQRLKRLPGFDPWLGRIPWRRKWQPTPVFLPGESHGRRSRVGYSPQGRKELDTTERLHFHFTFLYVRQTLTRYCGIEAWTKYSESSPSSRGVVCCELVLGSEGPLPEGKDPSKEGTTQGKGATGNCLQLPSNPWLTPEWTGMGQEPTWPKGKQKPNRNLNSLLPAAGNLDSSPAVLELLCEHLAFLFLFKIFYYFEVQLIYDTV